jgi:hypothetical protein
MPLSLDAIHRSLNDYFVKQFTTAPASSVLFRFDKFGSVISDQDVIDPAHPDLGYSKATAEERFSDLVNHVPVDQLDGLNVVLSQDTLDDAYFFHMLDPSAPYIPQGTDDKTASAIVSSFSRLKADAKQHWDNIKAESSTGLMFEYKPSLATPDNWYDKSRDDLWTDQSFQITETATSTPAPNTQLWKLRVDDATLNHALQVWRTPTVMRGVNVDRVSPVGSSPGQVVLQHPVRVAFTAMARPAAAVADRLGLESAEQVRPSGDMAAVSAASTFHQEYWQLRISDRMLVSQALTDSAPTQATTSKSISISFSYCLVKVGRPWLVDAFIADRSWSVPSVARGQLTSSGSAGLNIALMPIGFVAVRKLSIEADWSAEDVQAANNATAFGPFKVDSTIVSGKLSHEGIQIVGWLFQKLPDLPPN